MSFRNSIIISTSDLRSLLRELERNHKDCVSVILRQLDDDSGLLDATGFLRANPSKSIELTSIKSVPNESELHKRIGKPEAFIRERDMLEDLLLNPSDRS